MGQVTDGAGYEFMVVHALRSNMVSWVGRCVERTRGGVNRVKDSGCTTRAYLRHNQDSHVLMSGVLYCHDNQRDAPSSISSSNVV